MTAHQAWTFNENKGDLSDFEALRDDWSSDSEWRTSVSDVGSTDVALTKDLQPGDLPRDAASTWLLFDSQALEG